jgi:checkpoint serine/threonine-protein kinase
VGICHSCIQTKSNPNDENVSPHPLREHQQAVNPRTGRLEVVFVDLEQVYPNHEDPMSEEYSFEELRAKYRGWMDHDWDAVRRKEQVQARKAAEEAEVAKRPKPKAAPLAPKQDFEQPPKPKTVPLKGSVDDDMDNDENAPPSQADLEKAKAAKKARREERANRTRKIKVMEIKEVRGETQTSECLVGHGLVAYILTQDSPSQLEFSSKTKDAAEEDWSGNDNDPPHQRSHGRNLRYIQRTAEECR